MNDDLRFDYYALREGEQVSIHLEDDLDKHPFAVMARSVEPPGKLDSERTYKNDPHPYALLTMRRHDTGWTWMPITIASKEIIIGLFIDHDIPKDRWFPFSVTTGV